MAEASEGGVPVRSPLPRTSPPLIRLRRSAKRGLGTLAVGLARVLAATHATLDPEPPVEPIRYNALSQVGAEDSSSARQLLKPQFI